MKGAGSSGKGADRRSFPLLAILGHLAKAIESHRRRGRHQFSRSVEKQIELLLGKERVSSEAVARALGCGRKTLYRRLKEEDVTFGQLLDRVRCRIALRSIKKGESVKGVAYGLGFSDPSAFSRAFKRWTGTSPRYARNQSSAE